MEREEKRQIVEALILASPEPVSLMRIVEILPYGKPAQVRGFVEELNASYGEQGRAFEIAEVGGGYQFRTRSAFTGYVQQLHKERRLRLSQAALESLAVIAYKQPVTRVEVEEVRGVDVGAVLRTLVERNLVRIAGHREVPGRPMLYATTRRFLEVFGLNALGDLPTLRELESLTGPETEEDPEAVPDEGVAPDWTDPPEAIEAPSLDLEPESGSLPH